MALVSLCFLTSAAQSDDWVTSAETGCQVSAPGTAADTTFRWQGECAAGKARGEGILTSSRGGLLQGEFKDGIPHNARGFWPLNFKGGGSVMAQLSVTDGTALWDTIELPAAQGRATPASTAPLKPDSTNFFYLFQETPDKIAICRVSKSPLTCVGAFTRVQL